MAKELKLASWFKRFVAWLIDVIIVNVITGLMIVSGQSNWWFDWLGIGFQSIILLAYWTILEGYYSKSVGKILMKQKVVTEDGEKIDYVNAFISSLGKVYLLPIDVLVGLIAFNDKRQRLFQKLTKTIVIETAEKTSKGNVKYVK